MGKRKYLKLTEDKQSNDYCQQCQIYSPIRYFVIDKYKKNSFIGCGECVGKNINDINTMSVYRIGEDQKWLDEHELGQFFLKDKEFPINN